MSTPRNAPRQVPLTALAAITDALESDPDEVRSYLDLETGTVIPVFDEARHDLEALRKALPKHFAEGDLIEQRTALANAIENADGLWAEPEQIEEAFMIEQHLDDRFIEIPKLASSDAYRIMEAFVLTVGTPRLRDQLDDALRGRGAFRRFKDVLRNHSDERDQWFTFQRNSLTDRARRWLRGEGVTVADA